MIVLVRHGDAVAGDATIDDAARWLSAHGRQRVRSAARQLAARGIAFDRLLTSPRVRAVQTAELFAQELAYEAPVEVLPSLCFTVPARVAVQALSAFTGVTLAFGHMPTLSEMVQQLASEGRARSLGTASVVGVVGGAVVFAFDA